jgi:glycosyltransferase 2 family protein
LLLHLVDLRGAGSLLLTVDIPLLLAALLVAAADRLLMVIKWYPLLRIQVRSVSFARAIRAYLASGVAHYLLPASVGADVVRAVVLGRGRGAVIEVGASILAERALGLIASAFMAGVALGLAVRHDIPLSAVGPWALLELGLGLAILLLLLLGRSDNLRGPFARLIQRGRLGSYLARFRIAYGTYGRRPGVVTAAALLTLVEQFLPVVILWIAAQALGFSIAFGPLIVVVTLTLFAGRLPISLAGLGVREGALVYLLGLYGVPASGALAVGLLNRMLEVLVNAGPSVVLWRDLVMVHQAGSSESGS